MSRRYSFHNGNVKCVDFKREGKLVVNTAKTGDGDDYTVKQNDFIVGADTNDSTLTVTIPSAIISEKGRAIIINDEGDHAGTNNITVATEGSEEIDGSATATISTDSDTLALYSDGSNLFSY